MNLVDINLSANPLKMLPFGIFPSQMDLARLNLSYTNLITIELGTFLKPHKLKTIDLSANHFNQEV